MAAIKLSNRVCLYENATPIFSKLEHVLLVKNENNSSRQNAALFLNTMMHDIYGPLCT
jgi:hypothetical protein